MLEKTGAMVHVCTMIAVVLNNQLINTICHCERSGQRLKLGQYLSCTVQDSTRANKARAGIPTECVHSCIMFPWVTKGPGEVASVLQQAAALPSV